MITSPSTAAAETIEIDTPATMPSGVGGTTTAGRGTRMLFRSLLIGLLALLGVGLAAGTAGATVAAAAGMIGPSGVGHAGCSNKAYTNTLQIQVAPPTVYARNFNAGAGNDAQYVRYAVYLVNARTGATVGSTGFSGIAVAVDNAPARFTGSSFFNAASNGMYVVQIRVEWLNNARTAVVGWAAHTLDGYRYFDVYNSYRGTFETCKKF